jgi:dynein heavy chain
MDLEEGQHEKLATFCSYAHKTTTDSAENMKNSLKRIFYVTPTNYIELLKGYQKIIEKNRKRVDNQRLKLRNGLNKLDDAKIQVERMSAESEIKRVEVSR